MNENKKGIIFCIHGNSSSSKIFEPLKNSLGNSYNIIAIDLPGHGKNKNGFTEKDFTLKSYKEFLVNNINALNERIILVGHSFGGHLAIEIANEINNLECLIIFGTPPLKKPMNLEESFLPNPLLQTFFTENPTKKDIETTLESILHNKDCKKIIEDDFKITNSLVRKVISQEIQNNSFSDQFTIFTNLKVPKYIIATEFDSIVNNKYLQMVKNSCTSNYEIINFKNCGHYPSFEAPKKFNETINYILEKLFQ